MQGYSIRKDQTSNGSGILWYVREDIPCKIIKTKIDAYYKCFFVDINLRKKSGYQAVFIIHIKTPLVPTSKPSAKH